MSADQDNISSISKQFFTETVKRKYSYDFSWMGRQVIQYPQDLIAMQEIIWEVKPDLIIETGIAHGGSLIYYASLLELISTSGFGEGSVLGIDVDIRKHNRDAIENHPMFKRIEMIQGSSIDPIAVKQVMDKSKDKTNILVVLDSNHTHDHVLAELEIYAKLVSVNSYCVVFDTVIEDLPSDLSVDRPWGPSDNPKTAVWKFLESNNNFKIDEKIQDKLLVTVAPDGYLKRVK